MTTNYFRLLVADASFVDTLVLSIRGARKKRTGYKVRLGRNVPIASHSSNYARTQHGHCCLTGNPLEVRYGRIRPSRKRVPPFSVVIRSEVTPVTLESAVASVEALFRKGYRATISRFELTFDTHIPLRFIARHAVCRLRMRNWRGSLYFGSARSDWQIRVYQKAPGITRVEWVLRRGFLQSFGINSLQKIKDAAQLPIFGSFALREFRQGGATRLRHRGLVTGPVRMRRFRKFCSKHSLSFRYWTATCPEERLLRRMLSRFVW